MLWLKSDQWHQRKAIIPRLLWNISARWDPKIGFVARDLYYCKRLEAYQYRSIK
jgi:hypothetical protein